MATTKACHNCRRRRLRCDRSVPTCNKCAATGQDCQGYGKLYQWTNSVASRGRLAGKKTHGPESSSANSYQAGSITSQSLDHGRPPTFLLTGYAAGDALARILTDPSFQHMRNTDRFYLDYYSKRICQELVTHDTTNAAGNPFRHLIAMSSAYPFLQHILVASSAMHYSNVMHRSSSEWPNTCKASVDALVDALRSRHDAIKGIQAALRRQKNDARYSDEKDALLATVLFFINFALIDSGKGGWRSHMKAARTLIAAQACNYALMPRTIEPNQKTEQSELAISNWQVQPLSTPREVQQLSLQGGPVPIGIRDYIASDSVAYYIWGTTLDSLSNSAAGTPSSSIIDTDDIRYIVDRTEANSYHSCPAQLLVLILRISRLSQSISVADNATATGADMDAFVDLLMEAQSFDPVAWAGRICKANAHVREVDDLEIQMRTCIASAYRAAVGLYVLLAAPGLEEYFESKICLSVTAPNRSALPTRRDLATTLVQNLSMIPSWYPLFKYTTWPVFMIGVEAEAPDSRVWIIQRLTAMWDLCPWGMMKSAMETLTEIWQLRDGFNAASATSAPGTTDKDWLFRLRSLGSEFLIV